MFIPCMLQKENVFKIVKRINSPYKGPAVRAVSLKLELG